jgi:signal transduction histidine kinase
MIGTTGSKAIALLRPTSQATDGIKAGATKAAATPRGPRLLFLISVPLWLAVAMRAASDTDFFAGPDEWLLATLLLFHIALFAGERALGYGTGWPLRGYFALQTAIVLFLMLLFPGLDYFAILYVPLSVQAVFVLPLAVGQRWVRVFSIVMVLGMITTQGWEDGIPLAALYGAAFLFVGLYATATQQAQAARAESQALLVDLEAAYRRLEAYAARAEELAVVEERNRLARDLHDSVNQALYGLALSAEAANRHLAAGETAAAGERLRDVGDSAQEALKEMRLLIHELRPPLLEQEGLAAALQSRLAAVEGRVGLVAELEIAGDDRPPLKVEAELDRIAQEALNNALKHARAGRIAVRLCQEPRRVVLEIVDDGVGFDPALVRPGGLGLTSMAERAARVGGRFAIESRPGAGTRIRVEAAW